MQEAPLFQANDGQLRKRRYQFTGNLEAHANSLAVMECHPSAFNVLSLSKSRMVFCFISFIIIWFTKLIRSVCCGFWTLPFFGPYFHFQDTQLTDSWWLAEMALFHGHAAASITYIFHGCQFIFAHMGSIHLRGSGKIAKGCPAPARIFAHPGWKCCGPTAYWL